MKERRVESMSELDGLSYRHLCLLAPILTNRSRDGLQKLSRPLWSEAQFNWGNDLAIFSLILECAVTEKVGELKLI